MKLQLYGGQPFERPQPPLGGCVLKPLLLNRKPNGYCQPPLGGCVLKPNRARRERFIKIPAAFRRLCVETKIAPKKYGDKQEPAAFRRLCVETTDKSLNRRQYAIQPPSGGCVLKQSQIGYEPNPTGQPPSGGCVLKQISAIRGGSAGTAAFRRLCVETRYGTRR